MQVKQRYACTPHSSGWGGVVGPLHASSASHRAESCGSGRPPQSTATAALRRSSSRPSSHFLADPPHTRSTLPPPCTLSSATHVRRIVRAGVGLSAHYAQVQQNCGVASHARKSVRDAGAKSFRAERRRGRNFIWKRNAPNAPLSAFCEETYQPI